MYLRVRENVWNGQSLDVFPPLTLFQHGGLLVICHNKTIKSHFQMLIYFLPTVKSCYATLLETGFFFLSLIFQGSVFLVDTCTFHLCRSGDPVYDVKVAGQ